MAVIAASVCGSAEASTGTPLRLDSALAIRALNAPYETQANVQMAKNAGLSPAEIDAAATDGPVSGINPEYILVCKATDELSKSGTLRDETLRELLDMYGSQVPPDIQATAVIAASVSVASSVCGLSERSGSNGSRPPRANLYGRWD
jgi:hypothetical protein